MASWQLPDDMQRQAKGPLKRVPASRTRRFASGSAAPLAAPSHCCTWRPAPHQAIVFAHNDTYIATVTTNGGTYQPLQSPLQPPPPPPVPAPATCVIPLAGRAPLCTLDRMTMVSFAASSYTWDSARRVTSASFSWNITVGTLTVTYEDPTRANQTVGAPGGVQVVFNSGTATCTAMVRNSATRGRSAGAVVVWWPPRSSHGGGARLGRALCCMRGVLNVARMMRYAKWRAPHDCYAWCRQQCRAPQHAPLLPPVARRPQLPDTANTPAAQAVARTDVPCAACVSCLRRLRVAPGTFFAVAVRAAGVRRQYQAGALSQNQYVRAPWAVR